MGTESKAHLLWRGIVAVMALFTGLCTVFALIVTIAEAWQEHVHTQWPEAMARVERCALDQMSIRRGKMYHIHCRLSYAVAAEQNLANIYSANVPSREVWQYPPNQIVPLEAWVAEHPPGTLIAVRYDPGTHKKVALVATDMPRGGPHTPNNLKLLAFFASLCAIFLTLAQITKPSDSVASPATRSFV